jgi:zinc protease
MKTILTLLVVASSVSFGQKLHVPPVTRHVLKNGLTVMLMEYKKVPLVHLRLVVRGGSAQDPEGLEGAASMTASLMREGTDTRTATELAQAIDLIGGSLSVASGLDYCAAKAEVMTKDIDTGLDVFSDVILHPVFPIEEVERERKKQLAKLDALKEEPSSIASITFNKSVYGSHPYCGQSFGTKASLELLKREHLVDFYQKMFVPNNSILAAVGDFNSEELLGKITSVFEGWRLEVRSEVTLSPPPMLRGRNIVLVNKADVTQTQIRFGNIGVDIRNVDYFAIAIANTVLGGGFTSRLVEELRVKRSLTYGASSWFSRNMFGGTYNIYTFTKNKTITETIDVVLEELKKYRERGPTDEEWRKAQNYIAGSFARSLQTPAALAAQIADIELYGFPKDYLESYIENIRAVQLADGQRIAQQYFLLDDYLLVLVTPVQETLPIVKQYGEVRVLELQDAIQ